MAYPEAHAKPSEVPQRFTPAELIRRLVNARWATNDDLDHYGYGRVTLRHG